MKDNDKPDLLEFWSVLDDHFDTALLTDEHADHIANVIYRIIARQVNQARIEETKLWYNEWGKGSETIGDGSWEDYYEYRLKELRRNK